MPMKPQQINTINHKSNAKSNTKLKLFFYLWFCCHNQWKFIQTSQMKIKIWIISLNSTCPTAEGGIIRTVPLKYTGN